MLKNHKLLIDQNCPMCEAYGKGFTKLGYVDKSTIVPYQTVSHDILNKIDREKAKSEIALFDENSASTLYGIDAFLAILFSNKKRVFRLLSIRPIYLILKFFYRLISFNRHIIVSSRQSIGVRECVPKVNKFYRWIYIFSTALITALIMSTYVLKLDTTLGRVSIPWQEFYICLVQIVWQYVCLTILNKNKRLDYLGHMASVSMMGAFLLLLVLLVDFIIPLESIALICSFFMVVFIMFLAHIKRVKRLGMSYAVTVSWIAYRSIVLGLILIIELL